MCIRDRASKAGLQEFDSIYPIQQLYNREMVCAYCVTSLSYLCFYSETNVTWIKPVVNSIDIITQITYLIDKMYLKDVLFVFNISVRNCAWQFIVHYTIFVNSYPQQLNNFFCLYPTRMSGRIYLVMYKSKLICKYYRHNFFYRLSKDPVSYTHLDVYKRQSWDKL